jgi:hypothetical protein
MVPGADTFWPNAFWFSAVLAFAAAAAAILSAGARPHVRPYVRIAATAFAALAFAALSGIAPVAVAPIAGALGTPALALAVYSSFRRPVRRIGGVGTLAVCAAFGVGAAFGAEMRVSAVTQLLAVLAMLLIARRGLMRLRAPSILLAAGSLSLLSAASALVSKDAAAFPALLLFSSAGLLGVSLAVARISDTFVRRQRKTVPESPLN